MNVGILGGTFDPIHHGHLTAAEEVRHRLDLAEVIFMPAGQPWFKINNHITPAPHRVEMLRLALAGAPHFKLSTMEVERPGRSYTVVTITELKKQRPADDFFFILGDDAFTDVPRWRQPDKVIQMCRLVVVPRPGSPRPELARLEAAVPGLSGRVILLDEPRVDISSTGIRERAEQGLPLDGLVPAAVEKYIKRHKLYGWE